MKGTSEFKYELCKNLNIIIKMHSGLRYSWADKYDCSKYSQAFEHNNKMHSGLMCSWTDKCDSWADNMTAANIVLCLYKSYSKSAEI